ncbi:reverse transcriptase [Lasius niger]|uniref:Reverse transcriptase n=1 Tax=Lasius niger TaxID=67767 RepID=A0A0J7KHA4_LASNI|nr:reverse transcriptase [Lasius niger]
MPLKRRYFKNLPAPWLTEDIRSAMRDRDLARRARRRRRCNTYYDRYRTLRNKAQNLVRAAKSVYYDIFNRTGSANEVWRGLRHLGLIKTRAAGVRLSHSVEELNEFFGHNGESADHNDRDSLEYLLTGVFNDKSFHWSYVTTITIGRVISRAKSNAVGVDSISLKLLRLTVHCTMPILKHLFNFSLMNGVFPTQWQSALIYPIPKIRNPTLVKHYRPISILPTLFEALERVVCDQIRAYLESHHFYDPCQSAYRSDYSTQTCLIRMLDEVRHAADRKMITVSVFFDFSKAFNRVDHFLLIMKLKSLNFSDSAIRWIYSYLRDRTQAVKDNMEGIVLSLSVVNAGVPQVSVLGDLYSLLSTLRTLVVNSGTASIIFMLMTFKSILTVNLEI